MTLHGMPKLNATVYSTDSRTHYFIGKNGRDSRLGLCSSVSVVGIFLAMANGGGNTAAQGN